MKKIYDKYWITSNGQIYRETPAEFDVNQSVISRIKHGKAWKHLTAKI